MSLRIGQEIVLETVPVDPRDVFRGDYVALRYRISEVSCPSSVVGSTVFVPLRRNGDVWEIALEPSRFPPVSYEDAAERGGVVIRGQVARSSGSTCEITYGIESYFVPEGTGREIERVRGALKVRVSVDGFGNAMIRERMLPDSQPQGRASPRRHGDTEIQKSQPARFLAQSRRATVVQL